MQAGIAFETSCVLSILQSVDSMERNRPVQSCDVCGGQVFSPPSTSVLTCQCYSTNTLYTHSSVTNAVSLTECNSGTTKICPFRVEYRDSAQTYKNYKEQQQQTKN